MSAADAHDDETREGSHRWFDRGAAAWAGLFGEPGVYACPQCLRRFTIDQLEELSIEHVPPESIGGSALLLTCRWCNNTAGTTIERDLAHHDELIRFAKGLPTDPLPATIDVNGKRLRGEAFRRDDGTIQAQGVARQNRDEEIAAATAALPEVAHGDEIRIDFRRQIDLRNVSLALLRAGYLATFARFGYAYVCQMAPLPVRHALLADDRSLVLPVVHRAEGQPGDRHIVTLAEPEWLAGALAVFINDAVIMLPPLLGEGRDPLAELAARRAEPTEPSGSVRIAHPHGWPTEPIHDLDNRILDRGSPSESGPRLGIEV